MTNRLSSEVIFSDFLRYENDTGRLVWSVSRCGPGCRAGNEVGSVKHDGRYRSFVLNHKRYYTHRVIWELVNGPIPEGLCIDHIDGNGLNNSLANLRLATLSINQRNRRRTRTNKTGIDGVFAHRGGFSIYCASRYVAWTKDFFDACCARKSSERRNGYHENHGREK